MKPVQLRISDIKLVTSLQIRGIDEDHVQSLMETIEEAKPVTVYDITDRGWNAPVLVDGRHRRQARVNLGHDHIWAIRKEGTFAQALLEAVTLNSKHGLRLTIEDKKRICKMLLEQFPERANNWIAKDVGLSDKTVKNIRMAMESRKDIPVVDAFIGQDNKERKPRQSSNTEGQLSLHMSFNMASEDQYKVVNDALIQAGIEGQTKKANRALELICAEYLSGHPMVEETAGYTEQGTIKMDYHDIT